MKTLADLALIVVRHGRTAWNAQGRFQGHADVPLDDQGRAQARALARFLREDALDYAFCSDLARARETAEIILAQREVAVRSDSRWREMRFGSWEGLTWEEIATRYPALATEEQPYAAPGGESFDELRARVAQAVESLVAVLPSGSCALLVTHAGVLHALLQVLDGASEPEALRVRFAPASVTRFSRRQGRWQLDALNQTEKASPGA